MKKRRLYQFFVAALALAFAGCSHDELAEVNPGNGENNSKDAVYMNVTVQLPVGAGTRSKTEENGESSDGTEVGLDRENKVNSVLLVLADKDNKFIGCAEQTSNLKTNEKNGTATTVQSISKTVLSAYYGVSATNANPELTADKQQINVFIFCNPTTALKERFEGLAAGDESWHDAICTSSETKDGVNDNATIWGGADYQGGFLMSSSKIFTKKLPKKFADWENFTDEENPFKLSEDNTIPGSDSDNSILNGTGDSDIDGGPISVERSVARFDFKDASPLGENKYNVVTDPEDDGKYIIQIQLTKMALVNMSKQFYYLRRVSPNGMNTNATLCGTETSANYVVDTDAADKIGGESCNIIKNSTYTDHFNFCLGHTSTEDGGTKWAIDPTAREQWYTSTISDVLDGTEDNPSWGGSEKHGDYRIWRYVIENTIPDDVDNQVNGISTGIVFKGKMIAPEGSTGTLADAINNAKGNAEDPILYVFDKQIYVSWTEVRAAAIEQAQGSPLYDAVFGKTTVPPVAEKAAEGDNAAIEAVYSNDETSADYLWNAWHNVEGDKPEANLKAFKKAATENDFTIYESSIDEGKAGYYCYYFYWNRHNDNGNNGIMGPMEFDVVRNNVYKLAVTNIHKLGHPRVTENDPDPVDPKNPDEDGDVYLSVSVKVLPWVVRINNIEF